MKKTVLRSYAKLIARTGVNIEKGQVSKETCPFFVARNAYFDTGLCFETFGLSIVILPRFR